MSGSLFPRVHELPQKAQKRLENMWYEWQRIKYLERRSGSRKALEARKEMMDYYKFQIAAIDNKIYVFEGDNSEKGAKNRGGTIPVSRNSNGPGRRG